MLHKNLPKNNRSANRKLVKSPDKGDNSAIYNSINPQLLQQCVDHAGLTLLETNLLLSFAGFILCLPLKVRFRFKILIFNKAAVLF